MLQKHFDNTALELRSKMKLVWLEFGVLNLEALTLVEKAVEFAAEKNDEEKIITQL